MNAELHAWARRHKVSAEALRELSAMWGMLGDHSPAPPQPGAPISEAAVQTAVRLEAARAGLRLFRNNVGVLTDVTGRPVRYGLANDSKQVNEVVKSGDLIGWRPVKIEPHHVGTTIAQFVSRECKRAGWHYTGDRREEAQLNWLLLVNAAGGDATFCTGTGSL
jgi:hypothetical protein